MNNVLVKICGVTSLAQAELVCAHKPDMIGLNFVPTSKRLIDRQAAQAIADYAHTQGVSTVGIFQNQDIDAICDALTTISLDFVQLHGDEPPEYLAALPVPVIKTIRLTDNYDQTEANLRKYSPAYYLVDRPVQGDGPRVDLAQVSQLAATYSIILAGGLTADTINSTVRDAGSIKGVDVAGGVELAPGIKDSHLVNQFITQARQAYEI